MTTHFQPEGFQFLDKSMRELLFVQRGPYTGWLYYKHPDGQWVTLRLATKQDLETIQARISIAN